MPYIDHIDFQSGAIVASIWEDDPIAPPPTLDDYRRAVQGVIDETARSRRYDSAATCASYAVSTNPDWAAEALAFVAWRDAVWSYVYAAQDQYDPSQDPPDISEFLARLPAVVWPDQQSLDQ